MKVKVKQEMTSTFLFYYVINARIFSERYKQIYYSVEIKKEGKICLN